MLTFSILGIKLSTSVSAIYMLDDRAISPDKSTKKLAI